MTMKIKYDAVSNVGAVRSNNEDMAYVFGARIRDDEQRSMVKNAVRFGAVVADGMGGYGGGEIASEMAIDSFDRFIESMGENLDTMDVIMTVKKWAEDVNKQIMLKAQSDAELNNMGTTFSGIFTYGNDQFLVNCGDSRVYRFRAGFLRQLSVDHSERERKKDFTLPSNLIYNALGIPEAFIDVTSFNSSFPMIDGDIYLVCSDGICDMISDDEISAIFEKGQGAQALVDAAIAAGGKDNATAIVLQVQIEDEEEELPVKEPEPVQKEPEREVVEDDEPSVPLPIPPAIGTIDAVEITGETDDIVPPPLPDIVPPPVPEPFRPSVISFDDEELFYDEQGNRVRKPAANEALKEEPKNNRFISSLKSIFGKK